MSLSIIVAMSKNRVIGRGNSLPWHLPADLKYFKQVTLGKPIIMGRKTFESIGRPLPGRHNIVLSRDPAWHADGISIVGNLSQAMSACSGVDEVMVIGGAQVYGQALDLADRLYITEIDTVVEDGDAFFPALPEGVWQEVSRTPHAAEGGAPAHAFTVWKRLTP